MIEPSIRLRRAIRLNDLILVQRIVRTNPAIIRNPDPADNNHTSLHLAAILGDVDIVVRSRPPLLFASTKPPHRTSS